MAKHVIRRDDHVMIVEGYFDVVRLVSAGYDWVVAPLGTALTEGQAALLKRFTRNAYLLYDSDQAGLKATFRAGDELLRHGVAVHVVTLPEGEDPDSFVSQHGGARLKQHLDNAIDIFERKVQLLTTAGWLTDLRGKRRALDRLLPTIRATPDPITRDIYLARASEVIGVSREVLQREVEGPAGRLQESGEESRVTSRQSRVNDLEGGSSTARAVGGDSRRTTGDSSRPASRRHATSQTERYLVWLLLHHRALVEEAGEQIGADDLGHPALRAIYGALLAASPDAPLEEVAEQVPDEARELYQALWEEPVADGFNVERTFADCLRKIRVAAIERRQREIDGELPLASDEEKDKLIREKEQLNRDRVALGAGRFKSFDAKR
jgi:DNA primase